MISIVQAIGAALLGFFVAFLATFGIGSEYTVTPPPQPQEAATGTPPVVLETMTEKQAPESKPKPKPVEAPKPTPMPEASAASAVTQQPSAPQTPQTPVQSPASLNETVRATVVNILCTSDATSPLNSITASGVMIDPRGVILTNSHVAQYFLLKDYPFANATTCSIRTGNPATRKYKAELLFVSPSWIHNNAQKIDDETPMGNGEHDYALLYVTGGINQNIQKPESFPYLAITPEQPVAGQGALVAAYPAGFLGGAIIQKELYQASSVVSVGELYTFTEDSLDLFSLGSSILAQQGSSGGAAANQSGQLLGLIVTSTDAPDTGGRELRALSMPYLLRDFETEAGQTLMSFLGGDPISTMQKFAAESAPALKQTLVSAIEQN